MGKLSILTGEENGLVFKKMCINCEFSSTEDGENYVCNNEENKAAAVEKIKAAVGDSYSISNIELQPRPLKTLVKKCGKWALNKKAVWEAVQSCFEE